MASGLRPVELVEAGDDRDRPNVQHVDHVVGIDESGNTRGDPLVMAAVQCPRQEGEQLAELLIELGLEPWKSKSSSTPAGIDGEGLSERVQRLIERLTDVPATWYAVAGWGRFNKEQRGAIACIITTKAMTGGNTGETPDYHGPAVLLHDGGHGIYGGNFITLRRYAARQFQGFGDRVTPVYVANLIGGDKTYPEITAADYIAGYLSSAIQEQGIDQIPVPVQRIDDSWRASDTPPVTLYELRARERRRQQTKEERAAAWIDGRRPPDESGWGEQPIESLAGRLESDRVKDYILNEL